MSPPGREEFERLVLPLRRDLHYAALAFAGREADASDLAQDALLKAWRSWSTFTRSDNLKGWLFTILRNAWLDRCRARRAEPVPLDFSEQGPAAPDPRPLPEPLPAGLLAALDSLSRTHRLLVLLADVEGLKYREIAELLAIPIGSVMSGLHHARSRLKRALLGDAWPSPEKGAPRRG